MLGLGTGEIIAIVLVIFLLFGATRLPKLARSLGESRKALRDAMREATDETQDKSPAEMPSSARGDGMGSVTDDEIMTEIRRRVASEKNG